MREIIFRGKRRDNGEWVYGSLFVGFKKCYICPKAIAMYNFDGALCLGGFVEVSPESVSQYTGTNDNHGKKIFEGDIIRKTNEGRHPKIFTANIHTPFCVNEEVYYSPCDHFTESCEYEIIGNIHDNPELLLESKEECNT